MQEIAINLEAIKMLEDFGLEDYKKLRQELKNIFRNSRECSKNDPSRKFVERLIKMHETLSRTSKNAFLIRRHNAFVLHCLYGYSTRIIAQKQNVDPREIYRDINMVFDNIMVLVFGIDGLRQRPDLKVSAPKEWSTKAQKHSCNE